MMTRILGIDFGTRRIGVAVSNEDHTLAFPYSVVDALKDPVSEIRAICEKENISRIVIGIPHGLQGGDTAMTKQAMQFAGSLAVIGKPVECVNEFFSSKAVERWPTPKEKVDAAAAALILQSYLERVPDVIE